VLVILMNNHHSKGEGNRIERRMDSLKGRFLFLRYLDYTTTLLI
jgi:hypothetical protein